MPVLQIDLEVSPDLLASLNDYAQAKQTNQAQAVRLLLTASLLHWERNDP